MKQRLKFPPDVYTSSSSHSGIFPPAGCARANPVIRSVGDLWRFHVPFQFLQRNSRLTSASHGVGHQRRLPAISPSAIRNKSLRLFGEQSWYTAACLLHHGRGPIRTAVSQRGILCEGACRRRRDQSQLGRERQAWGDRFVFNVRRGRCGYASVSTIRIPR
jgi:hypothetical protein